MEPVISARRQLAVWGRLLRSPIAARVGAYSGVGLRGASVITVRRWCVAMAVGLVVMAWIGAASAYGGVVAKWEMNEPPGSTTMLDSSGSGISGAIGSAVLTGVASLGETAYRWHWQNKDGLRPERLVTVENPLLNPGTDDYAVTLRIATGSGDQNILQKGQTHTSGGMFKIDMVEGYVICMYKGSLGRSSIKSSQQIWDNQWHTIRCERKPDRVVLTIDGGVPRVNKGATGNIANNWALSIGGKWRCDPPTVQCDYYVGVMDRVVVERFDAGDVSKPVVDFTQPVDGSSVARGVAFTMAAAASDNVGVTKVEFRTNGTLRCTDTQAPYECSWTPWTAVGNQNTLRATAYDAAGNSASDIISVFTQ
jgi:hypothetical protein